MESEFQNLLNNEDSHLKMLHKIVLDSIDEEQLIANKIFDAPVHLSFPDRLSDKVAEFGGSWKFIISFILIMIVWISANIFWMHNKGFDPYPFILLNLLLSCVAALQAPIIMMSQNRKEYRDRKRAEDDYVVNLKAEIEIRNLHKKLDLLLVEEMKNLFAVQKRQMECLEDIKAKIK